MHKWDFRCRAKVRRLPEEEAKNTEARCAFEQGAKCILSGCQLPKESGTHSCIERRAMQALERNVIGKDMLCTMILLRKPGIRPCEQESRTDCTVRTTVIKDYAIVTTCGLHQRQWWASEAPKAGSVNSSD
jgi:hypothetical protein